MLLSLSLSLQVWSDEFYSWVKRSSRSYKDMEREVSQVRAKNTSNLQWSNPICIQICLLCAKFLSYVGNYLFHIETCSKIHFTCSKICFDCDSISDMMHNANVIIWGVLVLQVLGFRWYALNDKQFKLTTVNLNFQYYYEVIWNDFIWRDNREAILHKYQNFMKYFHKTVTPPRTAFMKSLFRFSY